MRDLGGEVLIQKKGVRQDFCDDNDTRKETEKKLKRTTLKYVNDDVVQRKEIQRLAMLLKKPRTLK